MPGSNRSQWDAYLGGRTDGMFNFTYSASRAPESDSFAPPAPAPAPKAPGTPSPPTTKNTLPPPPMTSLLRGGIQHTRKSVTKKAKYTKRAKKARTQHRMR